MTCTHLFIHTYILPNSKKDIKWLDQEYKQKSLEGQTDHCGLGKIHEESENLKYYNIIEA